MTETTLPNNATQSGSAYKIALDAFPAYAARAALLFAPREEDNPAMTVRLDDGAILDTAGPTLTEVAAQSTATITAPTTNPRIDRIVVDEGTGAVSVVTGTEAANPAAPAITAGTFPVARVALTTSTTVITNADITDERVGFIRAANDAVSGFIDGLITSNNVTDASHDIDIAAGVCRDVDNSETLTLVATLTKQIDAVWSVGSATGGLDTGTVAADTWYFIHLIKRTDTGVVDALFSTSSTSPTMPTNYDKSRLIAAVLTDGSANIIAYHQYEGRFVWDTRQSDLSNTGNTSGVLVTISVPVIQCVANLWLMLTDTTSENFAVTSPDQVNVTAAAGHDLYCDAGATYATCHKDVPTSTGQVRYRTTGTTIANEIRTEGWEINRRAI